MNGRRVLVPRPPHQGRPLADALRGHGAEPVLLPLIRVVDPADLEPLRDAARRLTDYDWVVMTSRNAVDALVAHRPPPWPEGVQVAAVGPATARALARHGISPDLIPAEALGDAVAEPLLARARTMGPLEDVRVLFPRAEVAREVLPETLRAAGVGLDLVVAYRTVGPADSDRRRLAALFPVDLRAPRGVDDVLLTSSSTATHLATSLGEDAAARLGGVTIVSIGPRTTETAQALGLDVRATADEHTGDGLVQALRRVHAPHPTSMPR